jgi:hypothetical protein
VRHTLAADNKRKAIFLLGILSLLSLADYILTYYLVKDYGFNIELNPILYGLMQKSENPYSLLALKTAVVGIWWIVLYLSSPKEKIITLPRIETILWILNAIYVIVVMWGIFVNIIN